MKLYELDFGYTNMFGILEGGKFIAVEPGAPIHHYQQISAIPPISLEDLLDETTPDPVPQTIVRYDIDPKTGSYTKRLLADEEFFEDAGLL